MEVPNGGVLPVWPVQARKREYACAVFRAWCLKTRPKNSLARPSKALNPSHGYLYADTSTKTFVYPQNAEHPVAL